MKITKIISREIYDCRGLPTIACTVLLNNALGVTATIPAGTSCGKHEAYELRDGGQKLMGMGVNKAINIINNIIAPNFIGRKPDAVKMDLEMLQMDGTFDKSKLGANSILAVSMALFKANAITEKMDLYEFIAHVSEAKTISLPTPMINLINGGAHAENNLTLQEYLILPYGAQTIQEALQMSATVFYKLKNLLKINERSTFIGLEGGFASNFENETEPLNFILSAIHEAGYNRELFTLGIDAAASQFYDKKTKSYNLNNKKLNSNEMIDWYKKIIETYNLYSIEDGLAEDDWSGWIKLTATLGDKVQTIGDDLFATNPERIYEGIINKAANAAIIKPNQIGTITETIQAIKLCKENNFITIASHRSGETTDTFIVDLAVGAGANLIKCGGLTRGERIAKYNRLLEIEYILTKNN